ncbi:MAG: ABC transporter permease [Gemmatimonadaceae bacterium]
MKSFLLSLVRLFPMAFRARFGDELNEMIARDYEAARDQGAVARCWFMLTETADLLGSAIAERVRPVVHTTYLPRQTMRLTDAWANDLRHAVRSLRRSPGFTIVAIGTLGLAIGANAGIFTVVQRVLLDPLPFAQPDRLMHVAATAPGSDLPAEFGLSNEFYVQFREQSKLASDVAVFNGGTSTMRVGDRVERVPMVWPTWNLPALLGLKPILGRLPTADDGNRVSLITYAAWQSWFGGDSSVIGKVYEISYSRREIIGVLGPDVAFPSDATLIWNSSVIQADSIQPGRLGLTMVARAKPGVTPDALAREFTALSKRLPERFGGPPTYPRLIQQLSIITRPLEAQMLGRYASAIWVLMASVAIVLLVACFNVANLTLVRTESRQREMALRQAVGAGRAQLMRLQLAETTVIAVAAGALAILLARLSLPLLIGAAPTGVPRIGTGNIGWSTLVFAALAAIVTALACGVVPALRAASPNLTRLRESGRGATPRRHWLRDGLVIGQSALALVLLIGSGLLFRSYAKLNEVRPGYETKDLFTFQFAPEQPRLRDGADWTAFHLEMMDRLKAIPGVESVGIVENVPLDEGTAIVPFIPEGAAGDAQRRIDITFAGPGYFETMGIKVRAGRPFTRDDNTSNFGNAVISASAAEKLWPGLDPLGRRFKAQSDSSWSTVVGVVDDVIQNDLRQTPAPTVYFALRGPHPSDWRLTSPGYVVRTARAEGIEPAIKAVVKELAPEAPVYRTYTMDFLSKRSKIQLTFTMLTLGVISTLALLLGSVGLYGVLSHLVSERTREIGVRMALGAEASQVRRMVVSQGGRIVGIGVVLGVAVSLAVTRGLTRLLYGVNPMDLTTFVTMSFLMMCIGFLASYLPARRASSVDPIESLRGE